MRNCTGFTLHVNVLVWRHRAMGASLLTHLADEEHADSFDSLLLVLQVHPQLLSSLF